MPSPAREVATRVLYRVDVDEAWAAVTLDAEIQRFDLSRRDAALATHIVYGTLRVVVALDDEIRPLLRAPKVEPWARAALRVSQYQLRHLARVPTHAIVDDAVTIVRHERGPRVAGFVNAVLRKLAVQRPEDPAPPASLMVPDWLRASLVDSIGGPRTAQLLAVPDAAPPIDLYVRRGVDRREVVERIRAAAPDSVVELTKVSPRGVRVRGAGDPRSLPGYRDGEFFVQEEGSQWIAGLVAAQRGERVLDACAGRGGKTVQLVEGVLGSGSDRVNDRDRGSGSDRGSAAGSVTAMDLHVHRLEQIPGTLERLRLPPSSVELAPIDLTVGAGGYGPTFDRVLVDAPCTGVGTLRRRPELLLRLDQKNPAEMADRQIAILQRAASLVRLGGVLVYAVCSPLQVESIGVARELEAARFRPLDVQGFDNHYGHLTGPGYLAFGPWFEGADPMADAYRVWRWVRV